MPGREMILSGYGLSLSREGECLVVKQDDQVVAQAPASEVEGIYFLTQAASLTVEAVRATSLAGAAMTFLGPGGEPYALLFSPNALADAALRTRQLEAAGDNETGLYLARAFVRAKMLNQAANLRYFAKSRRDRQPQFYYDLRRAAREISQLAGQLDAAPSQNGRAARTKLMAVEADAAKIYWGFVRLLIPPGLGFRGRIRRRAPDSFNVALNYGYGILYSKALAAIARTGLDPYVGFLHTWRKGKATFLFDFVEGFRPYFVDRPLISWVRKGGRPTLEEGWLSRPSRDRVVRLVFKRFKTPVRFKGKRIESEQIIEASARSVAAYLKRGRPYRPHIWAW